MEQLEQNDPPAKRKVAARLPADNLDEWLGGYVVFIVVAAALVGGAACSLLVVTSKDFKPAVEKAPLLLAWLVMLGATGALSWAGGISALSVCTNSYRALKDTRDAFWLVRTLGAIVVALGATVFWPASVFSLKDVHWPLGDQQTLRMGLATAVILLPTLIAVVAMWLTAVRGFGLLDKAKVTANDIATFLDLRERLHGLLWFGGIVIGSGVLATGTLRRAMIDGELATDTNFPQPLVLAYGVVFTLLLIISYVPPHVLMRRSADGLVHRLTKGDDPLSWHAERKRISESLDVGVSLQDSLKDGLAILAPIVAGLMSLALPGA